MVILAVFWAQKVSLLMRQSVVQLGQMRRRIVASFLTFVLPAASILDSFGGSTNKVINNQYLRQNWL
jgi:hypothetical protein